MMHPVRIIISPYGVAATTSTFIIAVIKSGIIFQNSPYILSSSEPFDNIQYGSQCDTVKYDKVWSNWCRTMMDNMTWLKMTRYGLV